MGRVLIVEMENGFSVQAKGDTTTYRRSLVFMTKRALLKWLEENLGPLEESKK